MTIPKRLRDRLGIRPGEILEFEEEGGRLVATRLARGDAVAELFGVLTGDGRTAALVPRLRGEADAT